VRPDRDRVSLPTKRTTALALGLGIALGAPGDADAHVTLQPASAPAGGFMRLDVRVPNERDDRGTVKVDVKLPPGLVSVAHEPVPGWTVQVTKEKLATPIKVEGFDVSEQISRISWTGDGTQGLIAPGQFRDFGLSVAIPKATPGSKLTFKALQTYQGGGHGAPARSAGIPAPARADDENGSDGLSVAALIVGALGLLAGIAGLLVARRATRARSATAA
jgi:uncharacterized protein YcnI